MSRKIIDLYLDVDNQKLLNSDGSEAGELKLFYGTQSLYRFHLVRSDTSVYTLPTVGTYLFGVDTSYATGSAEIILSNDSEFLSTDWTGVNGWDTANGRVCCRVNSNTVAAKSTLGTSATKSVMAELWVTPSGEDPVLLCHWDIVLCNTIIDFTSLQIPTPNIPVAPLDYVNDTFALKSPGTNYRFNSNNQFQVYNQTTGKFHSIFLMGAEGEMTMAYSEGEA